MSHMRGQSKHPGSSCLIVYCQAAFVSLRMFFTIIIGMNDSFSGTLANSLLNDAASNLVMVK